MYFDSSIPQGYGVGSSGALVAAMTNMPKTKSLFLKFDSRKVIAAKNIFSQMEAFFTEKVQD
jgi:mevalonate kinase